MAKFHAFKEIFNTKYLTETWLTALFDPKSAGVSMVSRIGAWDVYKTLQRTLTYLREHILETLSIIKSSKVYGWPQSDHFSLFHRIPEGFSLQYGSSLFSKIPRSGQNFVPHKSLVIDPSKYHHLIKEEFLSEDPFLHRNL